jgi:putative membrane protein
MKRSIIALRCIIIAGPALAQSVGEKTDVNSALGIGPTRAEFVKEAANSGMLGIAAAKIAQEKGRLRRRSLPSK